MKVGDKVLVKANKYDHGNYDLTPISKPGQGAYITDLLDHGAQLALDPTCDPDEQSGSSLFFSFHEFEVVKEEGFKVGDRVRLTMKGIRKWRYYTQEPEERLSNNPIFADGTIFELIKETEYIYDFDFRYRVKWDNNTINAYMDGDIEYA